MVLYKRESDVTGSVDAADGDQLYNGVKGLIAEHLEQLAQEAIVPTFPRSTGSVSSGSGAEAVERAMEGDRFLKAVKGVWDDHTGSMRKLKDVLKYMASGLERPLSLQLTRRRTRSTRALLVFPTSTRSA